MDFRIKTKNGLWWKIPMLILGIVSLLMFIISSIPIKGDGKFNNEDLDYLISYRMGLLTAKSRFFKVMSLFYFTIGNTELIMLFLFAILIMIEYVYAKLAVKGNKFVTQSPNTIWIFYVLTFLFWVLLKVFLLKDAISSILANNASLDYDFVVETSALGYCSIVITIIEFGLFSFFVYYSRFRLPKKGNDVILNNKYWYDFARLVSFSLLTYIILIILKQSTGRPYGVNVWFNEIIGYYDKDHNLILSDEIKNLFGGKKTDEIYTNIKNLIDNDNGKGWYWGPTNYFPWYKVNGNFWKNLKYWYPMGLFTHPSKAPNGWGVQNFPSGHTLSAFSLFLYSTFFVKDDKVNAKIKIFYYVWLSHTILTMNFLVIGRVHWIGDVAFTGFMQIIGLFAIDALVKKCSHKILHL